MKCNASDPLPRRVRGGEKENRFTTEFFPPHHDLTRFDPKFVRAFLQVIAWEKKGL
jgi:hypothetical protein